MSMNGEDREERVEAKDDLEPSLFCPVCSRRLTARKCKLFCEVCGYYLSCSDYY